jgi:FlaA1/EpsC-like NDP-sugar epimerase
LQLKLEGLSLIIIPLAVLLLLVIFFKPAVTHLVLVAFGHKPRTSFITAASIGQVSEFSLIIVMAGVASGAVSQSLLTISIILAIMTMTFTSYFMSYETVFYQYFVRILQRLKINISSQGDDNQEKLKCDVVLCGYDRIGYSILNRLISQKKNVVVVDFNPDIIKKLNIMSVPCVYGDIADIEVLNHLDIGNAKMVISTANFYEDNLMILDKIKAINGSVVTIVTAHKIEEALELYRKGADYVILPHFLGGDMVAELLPEFDSNQLKMMMLKYRHINDLIARKNIGHEHPTHM